MRVRAYLEGKAKGVAGGLLWEEIAVTFWDRILKEPETGCWLWQGDLEGGYATLRVGGKNRRVQRIRY